MKFTENQQTLIASQFESHTDERYKDSLLKTMIHRAYALYTTEALNAERAKSGSILSRVDYLSNEFY